MKMIKELKQTCATYGPTAPYTITLLEALAAKWMTPHDWKSVAKACLSGGQYIFKGGNNNANNLVDPTSVHN